MISALMGWVKLKTWVKIYCVVDYIENELIREIKLCTKVRLTENDPASADLKALQLTQNRMLRVINDSKSKDKIKSMLEKFGLL